MQTFRANFCTSSISSISFFRKGSQATVAYSRCGLIKDVSSMTGHFNYSSDRPYVDVPSQLLVFLCEVLVLPLARSV